MKKTGKLARIVAAAGVAAAMWNVALPASSAVVNAGVSLNGVSLNIVTPGGVSLN